MTRAIANLKFRLAPVLGAAADLARIIHPLLFSPHNFLACASLLAISVGCWWERPSLGLIVPGSVVFGCLVLGRVRGE